jgi:hypothetical protein
MLDDVDPAEWILVNDMDSFGYDEWLMERIQGAAGTILAKNPADPGLSVLSTESLEKLYKALWPDVRRSPRSQWIHELRGDDTV